MPSVPQTDSHAIIQFDRLTTKEKYKLLTGIVIPRPIALVSTCSPGGSINLAPYSFFNVVCHEPPVIALSCAGITRSKDTPANIRSTGEFAIAIPSLAMQKAVDVCGDDFPPDVNEFECAGLTAKPALYIDAPIVGNAPVNLECTLLQEVTVGDGAYTIFLGRVLCAHIGSGIRNDRGHINANRLDPLARIGGRVYAGLGVTIAGLGNQNGVESR